MTHRECSDTSLACQRLQVKHMLSVETDVAYAARKAAEAAARAPRPPIVVRHHS